MTEDLHPIDDLFRSGIEGKEDAPAPEVWKQIEKELDGKDRKPAAGFHWRSRRAAAILLLLLGGAGIFAAGYYLRGLNIAEDSNKQPSIKNNKSTRADSIAKIDPLLHVGDESRNQAVSGSDKQISDVDKSGDLAVPGVNQQTTDGDRSTGKPIPGLNKTLSNSKAIDKASAAINQPASNKYKGSQNPVTDIDEQATIKGETSQKQVRVANQNGSRANNIKEPIARADANKQTLQNTGNTGENISQNSTLTSTRSSVNGKEKTTSSSVKSIDDNSAVGTVDASTAMIHETAAVAQPITIRDLPSTEKKINPSSGMFGVNNTSLPAKQIPVLNKRDGNLDLPRFSITPVISVQSGSTRITEKQGAWNSGKVKADIEGTEHEPVTVSAGILTDLRISRNLTLQSGLVLQQHNIHIDPKTVRAVKNPDGKWRYQFDCSAGTYFMNPKQGTYLRPGDTAITRYSTNELNYLNIPLTLKWHFGNQKLQFFATAGAGINLLTRQDLETGLAHVYNYDQEAQVTNLRNNYFNGMVGAGVNWRFSPKLSLNVNPQYQFALTPINENMPVNATPRTFSMQMGIQIAIGY